MTRIELKTTDQDRCLQIMEDLQSTYSMGITGAYALPGRIRIVSTKTEEALLACLRLRGYNIENGCIA